MKRIGRGSTLAVIGAAASIGILGDVAPAFAERISNPVAEFAGIDKITGRITSFDVYIDETVQFGALQVTPKVCYSRDESEAQKVDAFVEVDEITLDRKIRRIFSGWMFADSPALNAVEHAIYDVWLTGCKEKSDVPAPPGVKAAHAAPEPGKPAEKPAAEAPQPPAVDAGAAVPTGQEPAPGEVPPLDAPQDIPDEIPGDAIPPAEFPQDGEPMPDQPLPPPAAVAPPGGVGLF